MNSQYRLLLQSIEQNYNNEQFLNSTVPSSTLFVSPSNTHQQLFLQKLINIYVLRKKQYNKISQQRIVQLMKQSSGGFSDELLTMRFMSYCMQNKIEVSYEKFGMLKLLTGWMQLLEKIKKEEKINLCKSVLGMIVPENRVVNKVEEMIVYLNYIAVDLQQIIQRFEGDPKQQGNEEQSVGNIQQSKQPQLKFPKHLDHDDLIQFLNNILPKTLYNIVIQQNLLINKPFTSMNHMDQKQYDFLFAEQSIEYFAKQKSHYQQLLKLLFHTILKVNDLEQSLQRQLMLAAMRYLYMYNRNKHAESFSLFTKVYENLSEAVRFALSDEFILFFKIIKKIGHIRFVDYLRQKYPFIEELHRKLDPGAIVGYPKDSLSSFHTFPIMQSIFVNPGIMVQRFIEILEPYSLLYFYIGIRALDINVRFYYLGAFTNPAEKKHLLLNKEKIQVQFKGNIIALEKGIYMFEFDNTYSWVKGKNILYDTMVLTPLDLGKSDVEKDKFLNVLFNKFEMNSCSEVTDIKNLGNNNNLIQQVQNYAINQAEQQKLTVNMHFDPDTNIYNLKTVGQGKIYEYETDNQTLFNKKAHEIYGALQESKGPSAFEWLTGGGMLLTGIAMIEQWCNDPVGFSAGQENKEETQEEIKQELLNAGSEEVQHQEQEEKPLSGQQNEAHIQQNAQNESPKQQNYPSLISQPTDSVIKTIESPPLISQETQLPNQKPTLPELLYIKNSETQHDHQLQQNENNEQDEDQDYDKNNDENNDENNDD